MKTLIAGATCLLFSAWLYAGPLNDPYPVVRIQTSLGDIVLQLNREKAPKTVANFLTYVREGAYDGTVFHRVSKDFIIQGGVYDSSYRLRPAHAPIETEAMNGLKNKRGAIAMTRDYEPNTATSQFFINLADNMTLDHHAPEPGYWGYTVFGKVIQGMDVLDRIANTPTGAVAVFEKEAPLAPVIIGKINMESTAVAELDADKPSSVSPLRAVSKPPSKTRK
ncbi:MAG: peptidylprolyl isomerase [Gammaproteobacteria bacterium]|nr:peptidylprolyl isomerase [Gammaproteobacteria bacterium]